MNGRQERERQKAQLLRQIVADRRAVLHPEREQHAAVLAQALDVGRRRDRG